MKCVLSNIALVSIPVIVLVSASSSLAQAVPPSAGDQVQQVPPVPIQQKPESEVDIVKGAKVTATYVDQAKIVVQKLSLTGQTIYSQDELLAVVGFEPSRALSLADLRVLAARIADHYHANGYVLAQA